MIIIVNKSLNVKMDSLFSKLNTTAFFVALCLGILLCYITNPPPQILLKYPKTDDEIYQRPDGSRYRLLLKEIKCKEGDKSSTTKMEDQIMES